MQRFVLIIKTVIFILSPLLSSVCLKETLFVRHKNHENLTTICENRSSSKKFMGISQTKLDILHISKPDSYVLYHLTSLGFQLTLANAKNILIIGVAWKGKKIMSF